jgi:hypothetical protein
MAGEGSTVDQAQPAATVCESVTLRAAAMRGVAVRLREATLGGSRELCQ